MTKAKQEGARKRGWWTARALYVCEVASRRPSKRTTLEEAVFLIKSSAFSEARRKATRVAKQEQVEYKNYRGQQVRWRFIQLLELQEVIAPKIGDGTEVYSRLYRNSKPEWIINRLGYRRGRVLVSGSS